MRIVVVKRRAKEMCDKDGWPCTREDGGMYAYMCVMWLCAYSCMDKE